MTVSRKEGAREGTENTPGGGGDGGSSDAGRSADGRRHGCCGSGSRGRVGEEADAAAATKQGQEEQGGCQSPGSEANCSENGASADRWAESERIRATVCDWVERRLSALALAHWPCPSNGVSQIPPPQPIILFPSIDPSPLQFRFFPFPLFSLPLSLHALHEGRAQIKLNPLLSQKREPVNRKFRET